MSDFIKVNFKNGDSQVFPKTQVNMRFELDCEQYNVYSMIQIANLMPLLIRAHLNASDDDCSDRMYDYWAACEVTKEEYDRLCKELLGEDIMDSVI